MIGSIFIVAATTILTGRVTFSGLNTLYPANSDNAALQGIFGLGLAYFLASSGLALKANSYLWDYLEPEGTETIHNNLHDIKVAVLGSHEVGTVPHESVDS
ncbi:MAG: hypothetical protein DGJ47_000286 [Rickettsiaceae bacterium]